MSFRFDRKIESDDDVVIVATRLRHEESVSQTSPRSSETTLIHPEEPQNVLEGSGKRTNTPENPRVSPTTTCSPRSDTKSDREPSEIHEQSRPNAQVKAREESATFELKVLNNLRPEPDINAEAAEEVEQTQNTADSSSSESPQPPKRRRLRSNAHPVAANKASQPSRTVKAPETQSQRSTLQRRSISGSSIKATNVARENLTTILTSSARASPITDPPKMSIEAKKQSETTLWIFIPSSADAVPLKLRSCMTMTALFDSVFKICGLTERQQQDRMLGLRTSLFWTDNTGFKKNVMLKREFEDCFETFLEFIDTSPCWENGGYCSVDIEPVMAEGT